MPKPRRPRLGALSALCVLPAVLIALTGCAKARAATVPDGPPLAVPSAPAHQIPVEQIVEAPLQEPPPVAEAPPAAPPPAAAKQAPRQTVKPETPAAAAPAQPAPATEVREVRVAPAGSVPDERKITDLLRRAEKTLENVDYKRLSKEGQAQYDQSKRFSDEAKQAVKEKNFVYAMTLADKAATLAAELPTR